MASQVYAPHFFERFKLLSEVSQRIISILELEELLTHVTRLIQQTFQYYHVGIGLIEGEEVVYRVGAGTLWDNPDFEFKPARLKVGEEGITGWVAGSGKPVVVPDASCEPRFIPMEGSQTRSELIVPIIMKGEVMGVLDVQSDQLNAFDQMDVDFMQALANQTGVAIENARLYETAQRRAEQFRVLTEVSQRITSILDINVLLRQLAQLIQSTFNNYHVEIGMVEEGEIVFHVGAGQLWESPGFEATPNRLKIGEGICGWVVEHGQPLMVPDVSQEPRFVPVERLQTRSELAVPIMVSGRAIGVVDVESEQPGHFDETDLELMISLANQAGVAIENTRLYKNAKKVAALEERQRLARELHDSVTQSLYGITLYSQAAAGHLSMEHYDQVAKQLDEIHESSQEALAEMRLLIYQLRPLLLEREGLLNALQARLSAVEGRAGLRTSLKAGLSARLPFKIEEALYHIAQEALNNVLKHAHAHSVSVSIFQEGTVVRMEILDDGAGFDVGAAIQEGRMGLSDMQQHASELGGRLNVESQTGKGTQIKVEVSL
jgi:signal transduction histidine kinase